MKHNSHKKKGDTKKGSTPSSGGVAGGEKATASSNEAQQQQQGGDGFDMAEFMMRSANQEDWETKSNSETSSTLRFTSSVGLTKEDLDDPELDILSRGTKKALIHGVSGLEHKSDDHVVRWRMLFGILGSKVEELTDSEGTTYDASLVPQGDNDGTTPHDGETTMREILLFVARVLLKELRARQEAHENSHVDSEHASSNGSSRAAGGGAGDEAALMAGRVIVPKSLLSFDDSFERHPMAGSAGNNNTSSPSQSSHRVGGSAFSGSISSVVEVTKMVMLRDGTKEMHHFKTHYLGPIDYIRYKMNPKSFDDPHDLLISSAASLPPVHVSAAGDDDGEQHPESAGESAASKVTMTYELRLPELTQRLQFLLMINVTHLVLVLLLIAMVCALYATFAGDGVEEVHHGGVLATAELTSSLGPSIRGFLQELTTQWARSIASGVGATQSTVFSEVFPTFLGNTQTAVLIAAMTRAQERLVSEALADQEDFHSLADFVDVSRDPALLSRSAADGVSTVGGMSLIFLSGMTGNSKEQSLLLSASNATRALLLGSSSSPPADYNSCIVEDGAIPLDSFMGTVATAYRDGIVVNSSCLAGATPPVSVSSSNLSSAMMASHVELQECFALISAGDHVDCLHTASFNPSPHGEGNGGGFSVCHTTFEVHVNPTTTAVLHVCRVVADIANVPSSLADAVAEEALSRFTEVAVGGGGAQQLPSTAVAVVSCVRSLPTPTSGSGAPRHVVVDYVPNATDVHCTVRLPPLSSNSSEQHRPLLEEFSNTLIASALRGAVGAGQPPRAQPTIVRFGGSSDEVDDPAGGAFGVASWTSIAAHRSSAEANEADVAVALVTATSRSEVRAVQLEFLLANVGRRNSHKEGRGSSSASSSLFDAYNSADNNGNKELCALLVPRVFFTHWRNGKLQASMGNISTYSSSSSAELRSTAFSAKPSAQQYPESGSTPSVVTIVDAEAYPHFLAAANGVAADFDGSRELSSPFDNSAVVAGVGFVPDPLGIGVVVEVPEERLEAIGVDLLCRAITRTPLSSYLDIETATPNSRSGSGSGSQFDRLCDQRTAAGATQSASSVLAAWAAAQHDAVSARLKDASILRRSLGDDDERRESVFATRALYVPWFSGAITISSELPASRVPAAGGIGFVVAVALVALAAGAWFATFERVVGGSVKRDIAGSKELEVQRKEFVSLLKDIVPPYATRRIAIGERLFADKFPKLTFAFCDVVGMSALWAEENPHAVCRFLGYFFMVADGLANYYSLFKVSTQGDSMLLVAGLPETAQPTSRRRAFVDDDSYQTQVSRALSFGAVLQQLFSGRHWHSPEETPSFRIFNENEAGVAFIAPQLKVGIHTGSAFCGVLRTAAAPSFDLYGPAVSITRHLQELCLPGSVHVSATTRREVYDSTARHLFDFHSSQKKIIKKHGMLTTYMMRTTKLQVPAEFAEWLHAERVILRRYHEHDGLHYGEDLSGPHLQVVASDVMSVDAPSDRGSNTSAEEYVEAAGDEPPSSGMPRPGSGGGGGGGGGELLKPPPPMKFLPKSSPLSPL